MGVDVTENKCGALDLSSYEEIYGEQELVSQEEASEEREYDLDDIQDWHKEHKEKQDQLKKDQEQNVLDENSNDSVQKQRKDHAVAFLIIGLVEVFFFGIVGLIPLIFVLLFICVKRLRRVWFQRVTIVLLVLGFMFGVAVMLFAAMLSVSLS